MTDPTRDAPAELAIVSDIARRALFIGPVLILVAGAWRGGAGAAGAAVAIAVVLVNFALSAAGIAWAADRPQAAMLGVVLGGYLLRLGIVTGALFFSRAQSWTDLWAFGVTLLFTHVALLVWESRYINLTLAAPGLAPEPLTMHGED